MLRNDVYVVCDDDGITVATFQIKIINKEINFQKLAVNPNVASKGIGTYCINKMIDFAIQNKIDVLTCEVYEQSKHAIKFYDKLGLVQIGEVKTRKHKELVLKKLI